MKPNYEIRVGLFALFALILFVWGWAWLKSFNLLHMPQRFTVRFHDVAGLNNNATVNINGVRVGTAEKVELISKGEVYVHMRITADNVVVTKGSTITIQTLGLVGAKYIEITLPELRPGEPPPPALTESDIVVGEDPVRVELVLNDIATKVSRVFHSVRGEKAGKSLAQALENSGEAVKQIREASEKLNKNMDRFTKVADSVESTSNKFGQVADRAQRLEANADAFLKDGSQTFSNVSVLTQDLRGTARKMNRILENPAMSSDLKETARMARETSENVSRAIHELNGTLKDENARHDIMSMLDKVNQSASSIEKSVSQIDKMSADQGLRSDVKEIVNNAREAMGKIDNIVSEPGFKTDIRRTVDKIRTAADDVDYASRQLQNVLDKRAPLLHMMFGRPGHLPKPNDQAATASPSPPAKRP